MIRSPVVLALEGSQLVYKGVLQFVILAQLVPQTHNPKPIPQMPQHA
jgi:hypothetical protein